MLYSLDLGYQLQRRQHAAGKKFKQTDTDKEF